ncbi:MAG: hypothetical protein HY834_09355 [Devosia nanyangense]|uniref:Uncharacterized protein n=1 Tax=Devosia nanyangense TaxID=1228055 RepID=A0A933L2K4_9HYPH|nr:hypothetical protein [Devosia nanyangense]
MGITSEISGSKPIPAWLLMLPIAAASFVVHLSFWPGQMSPDSIYQWRQLTTGQLQDAHPFLSTLLYSIPFAVLPHPAFVIAVQYVVFAWAAAVFLREVGRAGVPAPVVVLATLIFAVFPPNALISTTMWKDVPYCIGLLLLSAAALRLVLGRFRITAGLALWLMLSGALVVGTRHNGVLTIVPFFIIVALVAPAGFRRPFLWMTLGQIAFFVAIKTVLLTILSVAPVPDAYKPIFSLPLIGAMIANGDPISADDMAIVQQVMPLEAWRSGYRCDSVDRLFWNPEISQGPLVQNAMALDLIAVRWVAAHPLGFVSHQLCMTRILWDPLPRPDERVAVSPRKISNLPVADELGLHSDPLLPSMRAALVGFYGRFLARSAVYNRPATFIWLGLAFAALLSRFWIPRLWVVFCPALLNCVGLAPLILSQDYRYAWPSEAVAVIFIVVGFWWVFVRPPAVVRMDT